jgi:hypothetical protein
VLESASLASQVQRNLQIQRNFQMVSGVSLAARAPAFSGLQQVLERSVTKAPAFSAIHQMLDSTARAPAISGLQQVLESASVLARGPARDYQLLWGGG